MRLNRSPYSEFIFKLAIMDNRHYYEDVKGGLFMDINSIAGSSILMRSAATQQTFSATMMKQAAEQQNQIANLLAQNVQQNQKNLASDITGFNFSTYA